MTLALVLFAMFALVYFQRGFDKWKYESYSCALCGTKKPGEHHRDCPWKDL